jgi:nitroreductase
MRRISSILLVSWSLFALVAVARAEPIDALQAILSRSSVRLFDQNRAVTDAELQQIMQAGWNAQTLDGSRPFEFIQIRDRQQLETLAGQTKFAKWLAKAPAAIAVLVRKTESPGLYRENGALAVMNMYYKAQELGLGTCFQGTADREAMKQTLGVPENMHLLSVIPVGAPVPGKTYKSPPRAELSRLISQDRANKPATMLDGSQAAQRASRGLGELLGPDQTQVTSFAGTPLEPAKLRTALEASRVAPSSKNRQPWRFVLVTDPATKQQVARAAKDPVLASAPVVAVLAARVKPPPEDFGSQLKHDPHNVVAPGEKLVHYFRREDIACGLANLCLGARSQGLAVKADPIFQRGEKRIAKALGDGKPVSKHQLRMMVAIGIGYPGSTAPRTAPALPGVRVHSDRFASR